MSENSDRESVLGKVRAALRREGEAVAPPPPASARVTPRVAGDVPAELQLLLAEIERVGGKTRRIAGEGDLRAALAELVAAEGVRKATAWETPVLQELGVSAMLGDLGVEMVSPDAEKELLAGCDLGVTGVDMALPETGTLVLRSSELQPRLVSLLPRVHLAILGAGVLHAGLHEVFGEVKNEGYCVFVTGPSRTADIELTLTIGMHGPGALYVWLLGGVF
ncbi:MAG: lactate utilization protein [Oscillatoria princeps RMCB-10]|nr:lactate utilization protein [Oscillatoria princeps RMCB-10]